jgi:hypothetical protein
VGTTPFVVLVGLLIVVLTTKLRGIRILPYLRGALFGGIFVALIFAVCILRQENIAAASSQEYGTFRSGCQYR